MSIGEWFGCWLQKRRFPVRVGYETREAAKSPSPLTVWEGGLNRETGSEYRSRSVAGRSRLMSRFGDNSHDPTQPAAVDPGGGDHRARHRHPASERLERHAYSDLY